MGLFDNIILPEDINLPKFEYNPKFTDNGNYRLWQTKDLLRGQDRYRLRKLDKQNNGSHQLERRVPPIHKITEKENEILDENNFLWWNIVRPTKEIEISDLVNEKIYTYKLHIKNGVLKSVELKDIKDIDMLRPKDK